MAVNTIIKFLNAARSLANQGMSKEAIEQFARNEFGEINKLFQKQIDSFFKPKKGIENIKIKDEVFDDTVIKLPVDDTGKPFNPRDPLKDYSKKPKDEDPGFYTGGMVDVEPNLSDIGHGSDALMARTRLVSPDGQATTSTGLNYLLAEDNDNIRVPFQDGLSAAKKYGNILVADETLSERAGKELESKMLKFLPNETEKEKQEKEMFNMVKEFQKFKKDNPDSRMSLFMFRDKKKKEKELIKNKIIELDLKYPEKKIINDAGFVDKKILKETIDKAELDLEISPIDGLTLKRSIDTEGDQSVTSGTFDINNFSFSSPSLEEGKLTSSANFNIGDLNLSGTLDSKDSDILKSGIGFNYDNMLKGKLSESDGYKEGELDLNKTFPITDKLNLNLKGSADTQTFDGKTYKSSDLTPKLSYNDGILSADISKEIMDGGDFNLNAGASFPINQKTFTGDLILDANGEPTYNSDGSLKRKRSYNTDMGVVTLKGNNLFTDNMGGTIGYQKEFGNKEGDLFFTAGAEKNIFDDEYTGGVGLKYKFADGGRIGFSKGKIAKEVLDKGRRGFMKATGAAGAGIAALKTGLLGFGEKAAPVAKEVIETVSETAQGVPPYFLNLVSKIKNLGDETMATQDKAIAKKYKDYVMEEDFAGNITIMKKGDDVAGNKIEDVYMSLKVDEVPLKGKKGSTKVEEYEEFTARPDGEGKMKDVEPGVPDEVVQEGTMFEDNMTEFGKIKKADGGRIGFGKGDIVTKGIPALIKAGEGKFTKAQYLIERIKNAIKGNPDDKYVQETFPNFIKELEANPDLAKNENVFKELGGDLPEGQKIVVYGDDTLDFFTESSGPQNIKKIDRFMEKHGLSRDKALEIMKMEPDDQVMELTKRKFLKQKRTDNAQGGIQTMLGE